MGRESSPRVQRFFLIYHSCLGEGGHTIFCYLVLTIVRALTCIVPVLYIGVMGWPLILYADDMCLYMFLPQKCSGGLGKAAKKTVVRYTETSNTMGTKWVQLFCSSFRGCPLLGGNGVKPLARHILLLSWLWWRSVINMQSTASGRVRNAR